MRYSPRVTGVFAVTLPLMVGLPIHFLSVVHAAEASSSEQALEVFFQLGLPDTRGSKWVQAFGPDGSEDAQLLRTDSGGYTGNAWLVREEANGTVELVTSNGKRLRGRRSDKSAGEQGASNALPEIQIQSANLDQDLKTLASALRAEKRTPGEDDEFEGRNDYRQNERLQRSGGTLLFLAQLYRQGRADVVRDLLPELFAQRISADAILDSAVSLLADGRLAHCTQEWTERGDAGAFAKALDKLATEFPRGWKNRDAVGLLASKVREQKRSPATAKPEVKQTADLFLKLTAGQYQSLPTGHNWLFSDGADAVHGQNRLSADGDEASEAEEEDTATEAPTDSSEPGTNSPSATDPLTAFFSRKLKAVELLAQLLDDHRLLRVARNNEGASHRYSFSEDSAPEEILREAYEQLPRPIELGELAWELLEEIVPEQMRFRSSDIPEERSAQVLAWLPEIASLNDEQLAWYYLRKTDSVSDRDFQTCLTYLVKRGSPETQTQLQEVFLDPAVWSDGSTDALVPLLKPYLKRMAANGDVSAFGEKLKAVATTALETDRYGMHRQMDERTRKYMEDRRKAELQKLDQLLKSRRLADMLDELVAAKPEDTQPLLQTVGTAAQTEPWSEVEPALYRAAAKAKDVTNKRNILGLLQRTLYSKNSRRGGKPEVTPVPSDAPTREALNALLMDASDQGTSENEDLEEGSRTIADTTASILLWSRLRPDEQSEWTNLWQTSQQVAAAALRAHARALVAGQTPPPRPNATNVSAEEVQKIVGELTALPPAQIHEALRSKTPDQQLAVILHLREMPEWPTALRDAHLTVTSVHTDEETSTILDKPRWKGRRFDDAARSGLAALVEKAAQEGKTIAVILQTSGPLAGLALSIHSITGQKFPQGRLAQMKIPGLEGKPPPMAVLFNSFRGGSGEHRMASAGFSTPIWKDSTTTQTWKDQHLAPLIKTGNNSTPASSDEPPERAYNPFNPRSYEQGLQDTLALKPGTREAFTLQWQAMAIESASPNEEEP